MALLKFMGDHPILTIIIVLIVCNTLVELFSLGAKP